MTAASSHLRPQYQKLMNQLIHALPPGWEYAQIQYRALGDHEEAGAVVNTVTGALVSWQVPEQVLAHFRTLREEMVRPDTGAWVSAKYEIGYPDKSQIYFNSSEEPTWTNPPSAGDYELELTRHPRQEEKIPAWLRVRPA